MIANWKKASSTEELDARRVFPVAVLVAAWYDGQFASTFVCEAEYTPGMGFGRRGGGSLGACVVTHWDWKPEPPPEGEMLAEALGSIGSGKEGYSGMRSVDSIDPAM
jgi:hypothetical protein